MSAKLIVFAAAIAVASAGVATSSQSFQISSGGHGYTPSYGNTPSYGHAYYDHYDPHAHYNFHYSVHDLHTGDIKSQQESRVGDKVEGSYSLRESDGSTRTVKYSADGHSGFNAHVHRQENIHPQVYHHTPLHHYPAHLY